MSFLFWVVMWAAIYFFLPHVYWPVLIVVTVGLWPIVALMDQRQKIRESNKQTEKKWTGEIPSSTFAGRFKNIIGDIGGGFVGEHQQATSIRHSVQTVKKDNKEMAIWAIVSELNTVETMKQLSYVCDALTKLGHKGLADRIWAEAMKEDFYLKDKSVDVV